MNKADTSFSLFHSACRKIEADGVEGFFSCAELVGVPMALLLLVAHLRRSCGSMTIFPAELGVDQRVNSALLEKGFPQLVVSLGNPYVLFYTPSSNIYDNFSAHAIFWRGKIWPTVEHAYQAAKFDNEEIIGRIRSATSPDEAKQIAHEPACENLVSKEWEWEKVPIMKELLRTKAEQHPRVKRKVLEDKGALLIEDSPTDSFWGRGSDWLGYNMQGKLWVELYEEFLLDTDT